MGFLKIFGDSKGSSKRLEDPRGLWRILMDFGGSLRPSRLWFNLEKIICKDAYGMDISWVKFSGFFEEGQPGMSIHHILNEPDEVFGHQIGTTPAGAIDRVVDPVTGWINSTQWVEWREKINETRSFVVVFAHQPGSNFNSIRFTIRSSNFDR